jgi:hypothetical protein
MSVLVDYPWLEPIVQQGILARLIHDPLTPTQLYRMHAIPERWEAQVGVTMTFSKAGLKPAVVIPRAAGQDPEPTFNRYEQWSVTARPYNGTTDVDMQAARAGIVPLDLQQMKEECERAGRSIGRVSRNQLFRTYLGGHAIVETAAVVAGNTEVHVNTIAGWTFRLQTNGQLTPVGNTAESSKIFTVNGAAPSVPASRVIAAVPDDPLYPDGPGTLTLSGLPAVVANDRLEAFDRPRIVRSGGAASVDALTTANVLTLDDIQRAVALLRNSYNSVHGDGQCFYGHIDPLSEQAVFRDNAFQRANNTLYEGAPYQNMAIGFHAGTAFWTNAESPNEGTVGRLVAGLGSRTGAVSAPEIGGDVVNRNGVRIVRTIITASGVQYEKYIDERELFSEAGITGKAGGMQVTSNGVVVPTDRIMFLMRAPIDRLLRKWSFSWDWSGDFGMPSDQFGGSNRGDGTGLLDHTPRFKRAVVIESAAPV